VPPASENDLYALGNRVINDFPDLFDGFSFKILSVENNETSLSTAVVILIVTNFLALLTFIAVVIILIRRKFKGAVS
jgi:hypothetical protein